MDKRLTIHSLSLLSVEDDPLGEKLQVAWEIGPMVEVIEKVALPEPTGSDPPNCLDASLHAVRWGTASPADMRNIRSPSARTPTWRSTKSTLR